MSRLSAAAFFAACAFAPVLAAPPPAPPVAANPGQAHLSHTITGLDGPAFALAYSENLGLLAVGCEQGTIQLWNRDVLRGVRLGTRTPDSFHAHQGPVVALAWNGGPVLASAGADQKICLWSMPVPRLMRTLPSPGIVRSLAMSADGKLLAVGTETSGTHVYDTADGHAVEKLADLGEWVTAVVFSPDGKLIATGSLDGAIDVWDAAAGRLLYRAWAKGTPNPSGPRPPISSVYALAFSPDGKSLVAGGADGGVHIYSAADGKLVRSLAGHGGTITSVAFHPAGAFLASGSKDRTIRLWDVASGKPIKVLEGHTAWVQAVQFVARGTQLVSTGADQTIRVWNLTGK